MSELPVHVPGPVYRPAHLMGVRPGSGRLKAPPRRLGIVALPRPIAEVAPPARSYHPVTLAWVVALAVVLLLGIGLFTALGVGAVTWVGASVAADMGWIDSLAYATR